MFCEHCGSKIEDNGAKFCESCGSPVSFPALSDIKASPVSAGVDNTFVWILAFSPLIIPMLLGAVLYIIGIDVDYMDDAVFGGIVTVLIILSNIALCTYDQKKLEALGINTSDLGKVFLSRPIFIKEQKCSGIICYI